VESDEVGAIQVPEGLSEPRIRGTYQVPGTFLPQLAAAGNEARPPRVLTSAEAEASRSHIRFGPTGLYLEVDDEAESVWRRLGFTLNRAGMEVREVDESSRHFEFRLDHDPIYVERGRLARLAFWRSGEVVDYSGNYRVEVHPDGDATRLALLDTNGGVVDMNRAEYVLAILRERLG
ncbi:MAG: outer membrane protein assembly factor BamC, partial [Wenzhouxiangella sp.]